MGNESLDVADGAFGQDFFLSFAQLANQTLNILDENVISSNHNFLLFRLLQFL